MNNDAENPLFVTVAKDELSELVETVVELNTEAEIRDAAIVSATNEFIVFASDLLERCNELLAESGLPPANIGVHHDENGNWLPVEALPDGQFPRLIQGWKFVDVSVKVFSQEWYAARIGWHCHLVLTLNNSGQAVQAFAQVYEIGKLQKDLEWRLGFKSPLLTGLKQRQHLTENRDAGNRKKKSQVEARRILIEGFLQETSLTRGALNKHLVRRLTNEHDINVSPRTIRTDLKSIRKRTKKVGNAR